VSGGSGFLAEYPEMAPLALVIAVMLLLISMAAAVALTILYSYPISFTLFAVLGAHLGWFYTALPVRLSYRGLGEVSPPLPPAWLCLVWTTSWRLERSTGGSLFYPHPCCAKGPTSSYPWRCRTSSRTDWPGGTTYW
jgi:hypothetical protein